MLDDANLSPTMTPSLHNKSNVGRNYCNINVLLYRNKTKRSYTQLDSRKQVIAFHSTTTQCMSKIRGDSGDQTNQMIYI